MSFGVDISDNTLKNPKNKDLIEYNGIMMTVGQRSYQKSRETIRKNKEKREEKQKNEKNKYLNESKDKNRKILFKLMFKSVEEWKKNNPPEYTIDWPYAIILESPELLALRKIFQMRDEHNYSLPQCIFIPNHLEFDKFDLIKFSGYNHGEWRIRFPEKRLGLWNVLLFDKSYSEFLDKPDSCNPNIHLQPFRFCFIWGDYCGNFTSNKQDIEKTFQMRILGNNSYYVLTFHVRDPEKKKGKYSTTNCIVAANDFVSNTAKKYGYAVELLPESGLYKHHMYTCIFHVKYEYIQVHKYRLDKLLTDFESLKKEINDELKSVSKLKKNQNVKSLQELVLSV